MPVHETRGMGLIAEAGKLPQSKQYWATSTLSNSNENTSGSDEQSQAYVTSLYLSLSKAGRIARGTGEKLNTNLFIVTLNYAGFQSDSSVVNSSVATGVWL